MSLQSDGWCRHYSGMMNKSCDAGVEYDSIKTTQDDYPPVTWHCINEGAKVKCPKHELHTPEEIAEQHRQIGAALTRFVAFLNGEGDECPQCGAKMESAEKIGRCVYARPCGCRVMQGELPEHWKK